MVNRISNILRRNPLLVLEFLQYLKLIALALVGIFRPFTTYASASYETVGNVLTNGQYALALCAAAVGLFACVTNRITHRKNALRLAFSAFSLGAGVAVTVTFLGSFVPTTTLILNIFGALTCGAMAIHASMIIQERGHGDERE